MIRHSLLGFLSATIVLFALRAVKDTCAPASLTVHYVTCGAEKVHMWEFASHNWELASRKITAIEKDGRTSVFGFFGRLGRARLRSSLNLDEPTPRGQRLHGMNVEALHSFCASSIAATGCVSILSSRAASWSPAFA